ncbi:hypothetical protein [Pseudomonas aeruginosa]|uniref:hypothetical protein n=1 Tax=Pseudomonas aeruginosa TaxID=287 RepID=UPI00070C9944|nr:hypothetical protein [Pseudomonas aeruginosa]
MSEVTITCWQCEESMTLAQRGDEDGQCPHCGAEVDLEDYLIAAKAEAQALREEVAALRTKLAMAEDAAAKGDAARQQCGGMEMEIEELRAELAALRARVVVPAGWSGWATQYPGRMPTLFGTREIAELNWHPEEGARLIRLIESEGVTEAPAKGVE